MKIKQLPIEPRFDIEVTLDQLITIKHALAHYAGAHRDPLNKLSMKPGGLLERASQEYVLKIEEMVNLTEMAFYAAQAERQCREKSRHR